MSTQLLLFTTSFPIPIPNPNTHHLPPHRRSSTAAISATPPRWDSNAEPIPNGRRSYGVDLDGRSDDDHDDDGGGFVFDGGSKKKKRVWWSDYDGGEVEDDEEEEYDAAEEEFWGFKVLAAFGWMVPAVGISLLLGTGPNAFIMALAVPLGQRLISLAFEKVVGMAGDASRPRYRPTKTRRKPYPKAKADDQKANVRRESGSSGGRGTDTDLGLRQMRTIKVLAARRSQGTAVGMTSTINQGQIRWVPTHRPERRRRAFQGAEEAQVN